MANRHTIGEAVFDISFGSRTAVIEQETELGSYIRERLLPLADEIFNELAADGTVSKIDQLEIDLGDIAYEDFQDEMADRFRDRLRSVLTDKVEALAVAPAPHEFTLTPRQAELKQLWKFLETGRWQAAPASGAEFEQMLPRILDSSGEELVLKLCKSPLSETAVRRMIRQFPRQMLSRMIHLVVPEHAATLERLATSFARKRQRKQPDSDTEEILVQIWERLFPLLLRNGSAIQDIEQFFGSNMRQIFPRTAAIASRDTADSSSVVDALAGAEHAGMMKRDDAREGAAALSPRRLLAVRLESALLRGDAALLAQDWDELCREQAELLREVFLSRLGDAEVRRKLATGFDDQILLDLVQVLAPQHHSHIGMLAEQASKRASADQGGQAGPAFWEAVLDILHALMSGRIESGRVTTALAERLPTLGMQMDGALPSVEHDAAEAGEGRADLEHSADDPVRQLLQQLRHGNTTARTHDELEQLAHSDREAYSRLLDQLQAGPVALERLGLGELRQLVRGLAGRNDAEPGGDFEQEIARQAQAAADQAAYYRRLLQKLLDSPPVTFERIAELLSPQPDERTDDTRLENEPLSPIALLRARLQAALLAGQARGIAGDWQALCGEHAELLREVFLSQAGDAEVRRKLAAGFGEQRLLDLVQVLAPQHHSHIGILAEQARKQAFPAQEGQAGPAFWEAVLDILHALMSGRIESGRVRTELAERLPALGMQMDGSLPSAEHGAAEAGKQYPDIEHAEDDPVQQLLQQLRHGNTSARMHDELEQLAHSDREAYGRLLVQLQAGPVALERLGLGELRQLIRGLVRLNGAEPGGDFEQEIARQAQAAADQAAYYRRLLQKLLDSPPVTFERIAELLSPQADERADNTEQEDAPLSPIALLRARLQAALLAGQAKAIAGDWQALCGEHAELLREVFLSRAGDAVMRRRLAAGFPQHMLFDLVRLFVPRQIDFIASLIEELERHIMTTHGDGAALAVRRLCWEYTLEYLQGEGDSLEHVEYALGLVRLLSTIDPAELAIPAGVSESGMQAEEAGLLSCDSMPGEDRGIDIAYQQILQRLQANDYPVGIGNAVRKLVDSRPELFERLLIQLRTKASLAAKLERLEAWDLKQLVASIVSVSAAGEDGGFYAEIEKHVQWAHDEKAYYLHVLKRLLHNHLVDLEQAMAETGSMAAQDDALRHEVVAVPNEAAAFGLEQALFDEDTVIVADTWSTLRQQPAQLRETCLRLIGRPQAVEKLAGIFSGTMLLELVAAVIPDAARLIALLLRVPELRSSDRATFWRYALTHLHARKTGGFDAHGFVAGWLEMSEGQDIEGHSGQGGSGATKAPGASGEDFYSRWRFSPDERAASYSAQQIIVETAGQQAVELSEQEMQELIATLMPAAADLLREAERYAQQAENRQRYYHYLLQQILHGRSVDLEQAVQESARAGQEQQSVRHAADERWEAFEAALQAGNEPTMVANWVELRLEPAGPLQQALLRRLDNVGRREMLAEKMPEFIWPELLNFLAPAMGEFVGTLLSRLKPTGADITTNIAPFHKALRRYSLDYLVAASGHFGHHSYETGLSSYLAGQGLSRFLQVLTGDEATAGATAAPTDRLAPRHESVMQHDNLPRLFSREAELFEMLVHRLSSSSSGEILQPLTELAADYPETLRKLLHELQSGRLQLRTETLSAHEIAQLVRTFIELKMGTAGSELQRGIVELAGQARNENAFYRHILACLIDDRNIDLEAAQCEAAQQQPADDASSQAVQAAVIKLRSHLDAARSRGDKALLAEDRDALRRERAERLGEVFVSRFGDSEARRKLAAELDDRLLFDLAQLLAPQHFNHIRTVSEQVRKLLSTSQGRQVGPEFWSVVLDTMHALIVGRIASDSFTRELSERLSEKGMPMDGPLRAPGHDAVESGTADSIQGLLQHLRHGNTTDRTSDELAQLARNDAAAYDRLLRQLKAGPVALDRLRLDALQQLVLGLARQNGTQPGGDFEQEIARQAQAAADEPSYYRHILQQLLGNQPVDLEYAASLRSRPELEPNEEKQMDGSNDTEVLSRDRRKAAEEEAIAEAIYIANAGLVLAAPYLPHLFDMLGLTGEAGFKDDAAAERAVHLSQFVVNESSDSPEFLLMLNKILCGVPLKLPIIREIHCSEQERTAVEEMLRAIIANWKVIGNTSPEGLRRSFLERPGRLSQKADGWHLEVEHSAIDVLLDQLPWSYALIKYSWMRQPLYVEWR